MSSLRTTAGKKVLQREKSNFNKGTREKSTTLFPAIRLFAVNKVMIWKENSLKDNKKRLESPIHPYSDILIDK